jgi:hypothetical protein
MKNIGVSSRNRRRNGFGMNRLLSPIKKAGTLADKGRECEGYRWFFSYASN